MSQSKRFLLGFDYILYTAAFGSLRRGGSTKPQLLHQRDPLISGNLDRGRTPIAASSLDTPSSRTSDERYWGIELDTSRLSDMASLFLNGNPPVKFHSSQNVAIALSCVFGSRRGEFVKLAEVIYKLHLSLELREKEVGPARAEECNGRLCLQSASENLDFIWGVQGDTD